MHDIINAELISNVYGQHTGLNADWNTRAWQVAILPEKEIWILEDDDDDECFNVVCRKNDETSKHRYEYILNMETIREFEMVEATISAMKQ